MDLRLPVNCVWGEMLSLQSCLKSIKVFPLKILQWYLEWFQRSNIHIHTPNLHRYQKYKHTHNVHIYFKHKHTHPTYTHNSNTNTHTHTMYTYNTKHILTYNIYTKHKHIHTVHTHKQHSSITHTHTLAHITQMYTHRPKKWLNTRK